MPQERPEKQVQLLLRRLLGNILAFSHQLYLLPNFSIEFETTVGKKSFIERFVFSNLGRLDLIVYLK